MARLSAALRVEAKQRYDAKVTAGARPPTSSLGKYDNWIGPERIIMDTVSASTWSLPAPLIPEVDKAGIRSATEEYNAIKNPKKTADFYSPYEEPYDERV